MDPITIVLLVVFAVISVILIGLVLIQNDQSEGMGGIFGGGASNQVGNRRGNILTKATSVLGTLFLVVCVLFALNYRNKEQSADQIRAEVQDISSELKVEEWWNNEKPAPLPVEPVQDPALDASTLEAPAGN